MTEIQARYTVGNIVYVDFGRVPAWMRPEPTNLVPAEHDSLWQASESAHLRVGNTPGQSTPESLTTFELQRAVIGWSEAPDAKGYSTGQNLTQLQSILGYAAVRGHTLG